MPKFHHSILAHVADGWENHKKKIFWTTGSTLLVVILVTGGSYGYTKTFEGKIYPHISVGLSDSEGLDIGGLTQAEASQKLQETYNGMLDRGLPVRLVTQDRDELTVIDLRTSGSTDPDLIYDLVSFNVDIATDQAFSYAREKNNVFLDSWSAFKILVFGAEVYPQFTLAEQQIEDAVHETFGDAEYEGGKTDFIIEEQRDGFDISVEVGTQGAQLDTSTLIMEVYTDMTDFHIKTHDISLVQMYDIVQEEEAEALIDQVIESIEAAPYILTYIAENQREYVWTISEEDVIEWIYPVQMPNGHAELALDPDLMEDFFEEIQEDVDVAPQNARFAIDGEKVVEFKGSLDGVVFDQEMTLISLNEYLGHEDTELEISIEIVEPEVSTESVNDLGIREILGVGVSDFSGSPSNRIKNITHGAEKLNGLLISPDEEISLVEQLKPFTIEDGYLSELVIKGDEIKPEIGGGLCQIGTTTFRAAMNSGLEITERRNHSLVVSYYNDPSNNNPGTDATIYDPAPDLKFKNDTGNFILLTTEVDLENMELIFSFWGTSDGREAGYTPPEVLSWAGYGEAVTEYTDSLAPGVKRCQSPHPGATTSFDYTVDYADGNEYSHTYTSTYRSLPMICLVGSVDGEAPEEVVEEDVEEIEEAEVIEDEEIIEELNIDDVIEEEV